MKNIQKYCLGGGGQGKEKHSYKIGLVVWQCQRWLMGVKEIKKGITLTIMGWNKQRYFSNNGRSSFYVHRYKVNSQERLVQTRSPLRHLQVFCQCHGGRVATGSMDRVYTMRMRDVGDQ